MTPSNRFVRVLGPMPVAPGIASHSIVAVDGDPPYDDASGDGIVKCLSAHRTDVDSEIVVRSPHSCQSNSAAVAEVRRILLLHLAEPEATQSCASGSIRVKPPRSPLTVATRESAADGAR